MITRYMQYLMMPLVAALALSACDSATEPEPEPEREREWVNVPAGTFAEVEEGSEIRIMLWNDQEEPSHWEDWDNPTIRVPGRLLKYRATRDSIIFMNFMPERERYYDHAWWEGDGYDRFVAMGIGKYLETGGHIVEDTAISTFERCSDTPDGCDQP